MGNPVIFSGRRAKVLTADGLLLSNGGKVDNDGIRNYIANGHAEVNTSGWSTYADAAGTSPVDGTGGSPNSTWTRTTSSPLDGQGAFLFERNSGASRQGEGVSYDFTIDVTDKAKVLQIEFEYLLVSGSFTAGTSSTDSELTVWIYDVTNATIIQPSSYKLLSNSTTISDKFVSTFQTSSNSTSYRLIIHCGSSTNAAFTMQFDRVKVSPSTYVYGTPITDWQSYTPTITGAGTATSVNFIWRRVGDSLQIRGLFTTGTVSAAAASFTLPSGLTIDTTKISSASGNIFGDAVRLYAGASTRKRFKLLAFNGSTNLVYFTNDDYTAAASPASTILGNAAWANTEIQSVQLENLPILGWSSSVQMSDQTDTRIVSFVGTQGGSTQALTANTTNITFTAQKDTHGGWTGSTYVVPVAGDYSVSIYLYLTASNGTVLVYVNGSALNRYLAPLNTVGGSGNIIIPNLKVGDTVSLRSNAAVTVAGDSSQNISISRISGPSAIAATESLNLRYTSTSGQSLASGNTTLSFATKDYDSHGAFSSNTTFTAPIAGKYSVKAKVASNTISGLSANYLRILVNGSAVSEEQYGLTYATSSGFTFRISDTIKLNAGDAVTIQFQNGFGSTVTAVTTTGAVSLAIERVGN